jgi:uncharacterized membrane protein YczE/uncharacterized membrane protein YbhN (UPF0104 family)
MPDDFTALGTAPPTSAQRARGASGIHKWLSWILAAGALAGSLLLFDVGDMLAKLRQLDAREIALLLLLLTCDRVLMALKWRLLLDIGRARLPVASAIRIYYQDRLAGTLLPSHIRGDLFRVDTVAQRTGVVDPVLASIATEKVIGLIAAVNWAIAGGVVLGCWLDPGRGPLWIGLGLVAALAFNGLSVALLREEVLGAALGILARYRQSRLIGLVRRLHGAYAVFSRHPRTLLANLLLTGLEHGLRLLILYTIVVSLNINVGVVVFLGAAAVQTMLLRIPVTPHGSGTGELAAIATFGLIGIGAAPAFAISMIYRFLDAVATLSVLATTILPREFLVWSEPLAPKPPRGRRRRRLVMYLAGCLCFSFGVKVFIDADLGVDPFHAMTIGLVQAVDVAYLQIGFMDGAVTAALLLLWMAWNHRLPPISTFVTMAIIGFLIDLWNLRGPDLGGLTGSPGVALLAGLVLLAYGSSLIIMSGIGIRVVDLVALTLVRHLGTRFYLSKLTLEAGFLLVGFLFAGPIGLATVAFVCVVGPFMEPLIWANQRFLKLPDYGLRRAMAAAEP